VERSFARAPEAAPQIAAQFLGRLHAIPETPLKGQDRLSYRLLDWQLEQEIANTDIVSTYFSVNHLVGGHLNVFSTMAVAPQSP